MDAIDLCRRYQDALTHKDLATLKLLFTEDALIKAPISGTANVEQFHTYLFANTKKTVARFGNVIRHHEKLNTLTLPFSYTLSIASGEVTVLDGLILFEIEAGAHKIKTLTVQYDPS
ncbi:MAG TPA: hypothetical protein VGE12_22115, partial [Noviherbaspirillum sp.]